MTTFEEAAAWIQSARLADINDGVGCPFCIYAKSNYGEHQIDKCRLHEHMQAVLESHQTSESALTDLSEQHGRVLEVLSLDWEDDPVCAITDLQAEWPAWAVTLEKFMRERLDLNADEGVCLDDVTTHIEQIEREASDAIERFQVERKAHHETSVALNQILQALAGRIPADFHDLRGWATSKANSTTPKIQAEARAVWRALDSLESGAARPVDDSEQSAAVRNAKLRFRVKVLNLALQKIADMTPDGTHSLDTQLAPDMVRINRTAVEALSMAGNSPNDGISDAGGKEER